MRFLLSLIYNGCETPADFESGLTFTTAWACVLGWFSLVSSSSRFGCEFFLASSRELTSRCIGTYRAPVDLGWRRLPLLGGLGGFLGTNGSGQVRDASLAACGNVGPRCWISV
jgi:hypothetical protein